MAVYRMFHVLAGILVLSMPAVTNVAWGEGPASAKQDSLQQAIAACQAAKSNFRPLTTEDFKSVKADLIEAMARLDARLKSAGSNGESWRKFLLLDLLEKEIHQEGMPNRDLLIKVRDRFNSGDEGLALVWFADIKSALMNLLLVSARIDNPKTKILYEENLDKLANQLKAYDAKPTTEGALEISESVRWFKDARQVPELIEAVERHFGQPNLYARFTAEFINAGIGEPVDETTELRDHILGTDICGTGHTVGTAASELVPNDHLGLIDTLLFATTYSTTVGHHGPVCIYSNGTTRIGACKRIWVNELGFFSHPAVSNAVTQACINDIQSLSGRRLVERIAWKKAGQQKSSSEYVASRHAETRVNKRVDEQSAESLDKAQKDYEKKFRNPLVDHKLFPERMQFNTDKQSLNVVSMLVGNSSLASPTPPPPGSDAADMVLRVHESMINNFALDALGGMTVHDEKFQAAVEDTYGRLPDEFKGDEDQEPWAITFARRQPISVTFAEDGFKITLRGSEYFKGSAAYPAMDITAVYKIEKTANSFKAVRQGDIQILPPGRTQLGGNEKTIEIMLRKRFKKIFKPEILGEGFEFSGKWAKVGKMMPTDVTCRDGWLTIAWHRAPQAPQDTKLTSR